jgi:hypothetical protein
VEKMKSEKRRAREVKVIKTCLFLLDEQAGHRLRMSVSFRLMFLLDMLQFSRLGRTVTGTEWVMGQAGPQPRDWRSWYSRSKEETDTDELSPFQMDTLSVLAAEGAKAEFATDIDLGALVKDIPVGSPIPSERSIDVETTYGKMILEVAEEHRLHDVLWADWSPVM